jgi:AcrR family transcriptional regulator
MTTDIHSKPFRQDATQDRQQIIQAAADCFAEHGLGLVSMPDIIEASGLAANEVYRHFAEKNDILRAIGERNKAAANGAFAAILRDRPLPPLDEIVGRVASSFEVMARVGDPVRITPQAWGLSMYDDEIYFIVRETLAVQREAWIRVAARLVDEGRLPEDADPQDVGRTLFSVFLGFMTQNLLGDMTGRHLSRALRAMLR